MRYQYMTTGYCLLCTFWNTKHALMIVLLYLVQFLCKTSRKTESLSPKFVGSKATYNILNNPHTTTIFYVMLCNKWCNRSSLSNVWNVFQNRATYNWNRLLAELAWLLCNQTVHFRITGPRHEADHVQVSWRQGLSRRDGGQRIYTWSLLPLWISDWRGELLLLQ